MIKRYTHLNAIFLFLAFIVTLITFTLFYCSSSDRRVHTEKNKQLTVEEQIKDAVIRVEKKSDNPDTWPKVSKIAIFNNFSVAEYKYQSKTSSQILFKKDKDKWVKLFRADSISYGTMVKMDVPPEVAKEILIQPKTAK